MEKREVEGLEDIFNLSAQEGLKRNNTIFLISGDSWRQAGTKCSPYLRSSKAAMPLQNWFRCLRFFLLLFKGFFLFPPNARPFPQKALPSMNFDFS